MTREVDDRRADRQDGRRRKTLSAVPHRPDQERS